jgi:AAA domain-containing protein
MSDQVKGVAEMNEREAEWAEAAPAIEGAEIPMSESIAIAPAEIRPPSECCGAIGHAAVAGPSIQKLLSLGVLWPGEVDRICAEERQTKFLVQDFLPMKSSIAIAAGESTIGKSPLICQLGLCVAAGVPFLGMPTEQGRVLYFDLENSLSDCKGMRDSLVSFLGLMETPNDFLLMPEPSASLDELLDVVRPKLIIIDSLRAFRPDVTEKNSIAGGWLKDIRGLARKYDCTFLIVHHMRKPSENSTLHDLESCSVSSWLLEMEGPRAFVNQTDVRIAVEEGDCNPAALKVKWSRRVHGDSPLLLVERVLDEDEEPIGYRQVTGAAFLNPDRRAALEKLPVEFSTRQAKDALGRSDDPTNKFLTECKRLGLIEQVARGRWRKVSACVEHRESRERTY